MPLDPVQSSDAAPAGWRRATLYYAFVALLCAACVYGLLGLRHFDPRDPFEYTGDSLLHDMAIKAITEHGWYQHVDRLGAPGTLHLEDFPMCDNLCCAIIRVLALFTSNPFLIQSLFFLGLFPVTAVVTAWSFRRFGVSLGGSLLGGMLYALLPYHFMRGTWHLFLTAYFLVPPVCLVTWWLMRGALLSRRSEGEEAPGEKNTRRRRLLGSVAICALMGCNAVYYPFFACVLLGVAGLYALLNRRDWRHAVLAFVLAGFVGGLVVANLLPTIAYVHRHGPSKAGIRAAYEAEAYGLKMAQLALPVTYHRLRALRALKRTYNQGPLTNENDSATLGLVGTAGLLILLLHALFLRARTPPEEVLEPVSVLALAAILVGTIGGFSAIFALLVSPQIRGYNRISVFIAFYGLLASVVALDHLGWRRFRSTAARNVFFAAMLLLTAFGIWDETTPEFARDYHRSRHDCLDDARYFGQIEKALPAGASVFQLPAAAFPEGGNIVQMDPYSHLRGYLHTRTLRWSFGAVDGRPEYDWYKTVAELPPDQMLAAVAAAGFSGLTLDCAGYEDHGASLLAKISGVLQGDVPVLNKNKQLAFFDLRPRLAALLEGMNLTRREVLRHLLHVEWTHGFAGQEHNATETWSWCGRQGDLLLFNDSDTAHKAVRVELGCRSAVEGTFNLRVDGDLVRDDLKITGHETQFAQTIDLPPGRHVIHFVCDAPEKESPGDPRSLVWQAYNAEIKDVTGGATP